MEKIGANANIQVIGVTGNVASGKSTLLSVLAEMGLSTLSVDAILHNLYTTNAELINQVTTLLGEEILKNNQIDTKSIAKKVFPNPPLLDTLEKMTLPYVLKAIKERAATSSKALVVEFPLIFELGLEKLFDATIFVKTERSICRRRSNLRDITLRNDRFLSDSEKETKATLTITNTGTLARFKQNILHHIEGILA